MYAPLAFVCFMPEDSRYLSPEIAYSMQHVVRSLFVPRTRRRRHLLICLLLLLGAASLLSACDITPPPAPTPTLTSTMEPGFLSTQLAVFVPSPAHPGDAVTVICKFQTTYQPINTIVSTSYTTNLYGPFKSASEMQTAIATTTVGPPTWQSHFANTASGGSNGSGPETDQSSFSLPRTLTPGYYDLVVIVTVHGGRATARSDTPVQIVTAG